MSRPTLAELELAWARSRHRAAVRRAVSARRAALNRRVLRALVAFAVALFGLLGQTTEVATAPTTPLTSPHVRWPAPMGTARTAAACGIPRKFVRAFRAASRETNLSLALLAAVGWEESRMDPDAVSPAGAHGLLQLMPATPRIVAVTNDGPRANVLAGARYLRLMVDRFDDDLELALAAYNAGPTAVEKASAAPSIGTLRYAKNVEARAAALVNCM